MSDRSLDDAAIIDTSAALATLYQAPLGAFIERRRLAVAQLKRSGHKDLAARLATAAKPSRAAHLVNQVYWRTRRVYDAVLEAGTAARAAQQARLLGDGDADLPQTMRVRDEAVRAGVEEAVRLASAEGLGAGDVLTTHLRASFEALASHGQEGRLPHGLLVEDVPLLGLQAFAGLVLAADPPPTRRFEIVARQTPPAVEEPPAPDPRLEEAANRVARARQRHGEAQERLAELERSVAAAAESLSRDEAELAALQGRVVASRQAVETGRVAREVAARDAEACRTALATTQDELTALEAEGAGGGRPPAPPPPAPRRTRRR